jgi:hypothetical protein
MQTVSGTELPGNLTMAEAAKLIDMLKSQRHTMRRLQSGYDR